MAHKKDRNRKPSHYITPEGSEAESEPGSRGRVLRNRIGIRRKLEMDRQEFESLVAVQEKYLECIGPDTRLTADLLCRMHRDWLGEIYEWAGRHRTVELSKGGFRWPPAFRIAPNMDAFERGVLARWVSDLMAFQAGLPAPDYGFTGRNSKSRSAAYWEAVRQGYMRDYDRLTIFFAEALERRLRRGFES